MHFLIVDRLLNGEISNFGQNIWGESENLNFAIEAYLAWFDADGFYEAIWGLPSSVFKMIINSLVFSAV